MTIKINEADFIRVCNESQSMAQACSVLKLHFNTFKRYAMKFGCYKINPAGKGMNKSWKKSQIKTEDILSGKYPSYQTFKLKQRLLSEGIKDNKCEVCGLSGLWNDKPLNMELEHVDGNRTNHKKGNLLMICPNCHAQTETYRAKNIS